MLARSSATLAALALLAGGCVTAPGEEPHGTGPGEPGLTVTATTSIVGDIVANVLGDYGSVEVILPRGADPHSFAPSAAQVAAMTKADLIVANGLGLEASLAGAFDVVRDRGVPVFELASAYTHVIGGGNEHAAQDEDEHAGADPHIWFDARQMAGAVLALGERLAAVDEGLPDERWARRARAYHDEVIAADREVAEVVAAVPEERRKLVTNHDTLAYFAARYGFETIGTAIPGLSSDAEPSARQVADLVAVIERAGVPAIFSENTTSDRLIRAVAREVGHEVAVVPLLTDALAPPGEEGDTYVGLLVTNARRIAEALA